MMEPAATQPAPVTAEAVMPLLRMTGISKSFPGVHALQDVSLEIYPGECLALMGENGAGKSTLMKVLSGVYSPDAGTVEIQGSQVTLTNPHQAQQLGISIIYQEFNLFPNMSVEENVFIGREPSRRRRGRSPHAPPEHPRIARPAGRPAPPGCAGRRSERGPTADGRDRQGTLLQRPHRDHGRADLRPDRYEVTALFEIIRGLKQRNLGVIFISHRIEEVARDRGSIRSCATVVMPAKS